MKHINPDNAFASMPEAGGTRWNGTGACGVGLGSTALVWREDR